MQDDYCSNCGTRASYRCPNCGTTFCTSCRFASEIDKHGHQQQFQPCPSCTAAARGAWQAARANLSTVECSLREGKTTPQTTATERSELFMRLADVAVTSHQPTVIVEGHRGVFQNGLGPNAPLLPVRTRQGWKLEIGSKVAYLDTGRRWVNITAPRRQGPPLAAGPHYVTDSGSWTQTMPLSITINGELPRVQP